MKHFTHGEIQRPFCSRDWDSLYPAGVAKAELNWLELAVKSLLAGVFAGMGGLFSIIVTGRAVGLRESNPSIATLLGSLVFSLGFVLIIITNTELATANMFVMAYSTLQRKTSLLAMGRVIVLSYCYNICGCLFFAWFLAYWTDSLRSPAEKDFVVAQAEDRVQVANYWPTNFLRAVGCNWLVCLAYFLSTGVREYVSKIYAVSFPVWAFGVLGYQHSVANFFLVPIGMFQGTSFGVGEFIYKSIIPVTIGNIVGAGVFTPLPFWILYGREESMIEGSNVLQDEEKGMNGGLVLKSNGH